MKKSIYVLVFSLFFVVSALVHIPAAWVYQWLPQSSQVKVSGISGTPWQGQASRLSVDNYQLGQVQWHFKPLKLLLAHLEYEVEFGQGSQLQLMGKGKVGLGFGGAYARDVLASMPAIQAMALANLPASIPVNVKGQLELTLNELDYGFPWCQSGQGSLIWTRAQIESPLANLNPGPVRSDFSCQDNKIQAKGNQQSPQVSAGFDVNLIAGDRPDQGSFQVDSWFKPGAEFPNELASQLSWLGEPDSQGRYPFKQSGRF
ncbi:MAG: type II secretion system protein N [Vibrio sp.]